MCECGCVLNDRRYTFPAPDGAFYLLSLSGCCVNCDAPSGVTIERCDVGSFNHGYYSNPDYIDGPLPFEKWSDSVCVAIVTGMDRSEFIKSTKQHLIGVDSSDIGECYVIDDIGAETILEEMYEDAQLRPSLVVPKGK